MTTKNSSRVSKNFYSVSRHLHLLITLLTFLPMVFFKFGRLDDFSLYLYTRDDVQGVITSGFSFGRPITTLIIGKSFGLINDINGFSILRGGSLLLLLFIVYFATKFYSPEHKVKSMLLFFLLLYYISLPGLWVFMSWAQGFPHILGILFVLISVKAYCSPHHQKYYFVFSVLAFFTYQPFGLLIPILLVPKLFKVAAKNVVGEFIKIYLWMSFLSLVNYLVVKTQVAPNTRAEITSEYLVKLTWFVSEWIPRVLFPWSLKVNVIGSAIVGIIFVLLIFNFMQKSKMSRVLILLSSMALPSLPFLITSENWASSRAILASNISFSIGLTFLAINCFSQERPKLTLKLATSGFVAIFFMNSVYIGYGSLVLPQSQEWESTLRELSLAPNETKELTAHLAFFEQTSSNRLSYDEFGILNSSVPNPLIGMLTMAVSPYWLVDVPININSERKCQKFGSGLDEKTKSFNLYPLVGMPGC